MGGTFIPQFNGTSELGARGLTNNVLYGESSYWKGGGEEWATNHIGVGKEWGKSRHYSSIAWFFFLTFVTAVAYVRFQARMLCNLDGNLGEDFVCALLYPCAIQQVKLHLEEEVVSDSADSDD